MEEKKKPKLSEASALPMVPLEKGLKEEEKNELCRK